MFNHDEDRWPIVRQVMAGVLTADEGQAFLDASDALLRRGRPYVLVSVVAADCVVPHAIRRAHAVWFRRNRAPLGRLCFGVARVRPGRPHSAADNARLVRAVPYPMETFEDEATAERFVAARAAALPESCRTEAVATHRAG